MISFEVTGSFDKTENFLKRIKSSNFLSMLDRYGKLGCDALSSATPYRSGLTAASWSYEINKTSKGVSLVWINSNDNNGTNIALLIQYGHATRNGGYVNGYDFINPAMRPIFDKISEEVWKEVSRP